nr:MAG TPA: hypothetical protein [Caudoviricetes sp.]
MDIFYNSARIHLYFQIRSLSTLVQVILFQIHKAFCSL